MITLSIMLAVLVGQNLFARTYGGSNDDRAYSVIQTPDGGYVVAGWSTSFGASSDFLVLKLTTTGDLQWSNNFGGSGWDECRNVIQTADGNYMVTGHTNSFGAGGFDLLMLKLNTSGTLSWARTLGGSGGEHGGHSISIIQTTDGGYAYAGWTTGFGAGGDDFIIMKITSTGSLSWARTFGGTGLDNAKSITQTADGGYAIAGNTRSFGAGGDDFIIMKITSTGSLSWARTFGGTNNDSLFSMTKTTDGGFVLAGYTRSFGAGSLDFLVIKISSTGNLVWARTFGGENIEWPYCIIQTTDGGYAVAGSTSSFGVSGSDFFILKLSSDGSLDWARTFGGTGSETATSIIQTTDGGYAIVGVTSSFGVSVRDFLFLRLDPNGNYPGCVVNCTPTITTPSLSTSSPTGLLSCTPTERNPNLTVTTPAPTIADVCLPVDVKDIDPTSPKSGIICFSPIPSGVLFVSNEDIVINLYSPDGRLAYSGNLKKGENRITLDRGVYIWIAESYGDKIVIR